MRFIHAADLHIDSPLRGLSRYEGAPLARLRGATRRALERLVALAIDEKVDFVLMAGDLYDGKWEDFHTGLFVNAQMVALKKAGIQVFIVQGNHDAQSHMTKRIPWPDNVKVFSSRTAETVHLKNLGVAIHGHSFPDREVAEDLVPRYPAAVPGCFNIGLLHTSLTGAEGHDTYAPTTLANLKNKGYDYWALGHIHARQVVCESPRVVFPGNLQGRHAREIGPKGCELVTVEGAAGGLLGRMSARFVPLDVVRWHVVPVDLQSLAQLDDVRASVLQALHAAVDEANASEALHAMRVVLTGETVLHALEASQPGTLEATVRGAAQEFSSSVIWIERVKLQLRSPLDRAKIGQGAGALGELVRWVDELSGDGAALETFCRETLKEVLGKDKLPPEVKAALAHEPSDGDIPEWGDVAALLALVKDAEATLLARLSTPEENAEKIKNAEKIEKAAP